ncbi:MAG: hypothetical protein RIE58_07035 [Vicingaceae bacterium]
MDSKIELEKYEEFKSTINSCLERFYLPDYLINDFVYGYVFETNVLESTNQIKAEIIEELKNALINGSNYVQESIIDDLKTFTQSLNKARLITELYYRDTDDLIDLRMSNSTSFKYFTEHIKNGSIPEKEKDRVKLSYSILINSLNSVYESFHFSKDILEPLYKSENDYKKYLKQYWFIVGLNFASGKIQELMKECNDNASLVARKLGNQNYRPYITDSIQDTKASDKNIFRNSHKLSSIIEYCEINKIPVIDKFKSRYNQLKSHE